VNPQRYLPRALPRALEGLATLALDLRGGWNHGADALWEAVDSRLWEATGNAWLILESVSGARLEALAADPDFVAELGRQLADRTAYLERAAWFRTVHGSKALGGVAYLSMEFGLGEALPIYSGGLGILAGDHLKTASDLGVPLVGVGLLYQQGYFRQALDAGGGQLAFYPYSNPSMLPAMPLRDADGGWLRVTVELPGRVLQLRGWQVRVGHVSLYLLDANDPLNAPGDRGITAELYGGGPEMRLQQEIVLGIGGWRLLAALGHACDVCHLNEGHAAFAVLERARAFMAASGRSFAEALAATRAGNLFTTHTPVAAGFDRFAPGLFRQYFQAYADALGLAVDDLLALGRTPGEGPEAPFTMAWLALHGAGRVNGVSRLHGEVSRRLFGALFPRRPEAEVPVGHVTNGVHVPSWDSAAAAALWSRACGAGRWMGTLERLEEDFRRLDDKTLWDLRCVGRRRLVEQVRGRLERQRAMQGLDAAAGARCLDPDVLTVGLARRFATYKRPDLLLADPERLTRLLTRPERPMQLVVAGKAHPADEAGRRIVAAWARYAARPEVAGRVVFVADYDMALAAELVQGVDLWINTPRRPWEACGTSGMKLLVNGGLNLSVRDGWWAEGYAPEVGWTVGDDTDGGDDGADAEALYALLEGEVARAFYDRDGGGIPAEWVARMRESMARLTPRFSANRMVREYVDEHYLPAAQGYRRRAARRGALGARLAAWRADLDGHWDSVRFGAWEVEAGETAHRFQAQVFLGGLDPEAVRVELYAEPVGDGAPEVHPMTRGAPLAGTVGGHLYAATLAAERPAEGYTARVVPHHPEARVPLEAPLIRWQR